MDRAVAEQARWWSWRRQRLDRSCRGVEDALRSVIGVYSANPSGPLSLLARVPRLLKGAAVEGVISTRRAVRIPSMRRSIYLVPTDTAHLAFWATTTGGKEYRWLLSRSGISERTYARLKADVLALCALPPNAEDIRAGLPRAPKALGAVIQAICADGDLLRIKAPSIRSNEFTYARTDVWLGEPLKRVEPSEALVWLAGDYLTAYGPATAGDFAWWTGQPLAKAAEAIAGHDPVDVGGKSFLHRRDERAYEMMRPHLGRVNLLPKWDCYTMGYGPEGRARFCPRDVLAHAYDRGGNAQPVVLVEGEVQGLWETRFSRDGSRVTVRFRMFDAPGPKLRAALQAEAELVAGFLEASAVAVEEERLARRAAPPRAPKARARAAHARRSR